MNKQISNSEESAFDDLDDQIHGVDVIAEKLKDALTPGYQVEFDPEEAEQAGAFVEDALSEQEAMESDVDVLDVLALEVEQE